MFHGGGFQGGMGVPGGWVFQGDGCSRGMVFQGDECSGGWVSRGMGVPDTPLMCSKCRLTSPTIRTHLSISQIYIN